MMNKIFLLLKSRTFWTLVITFIVAGSESIRDAVSPQTYDAIMFVLLALASYFKISPSQNYSGSGKG